MTNNIINIKCAIIGAGGIGSYLVEHIDRLIDLNQINNITFTVYDNDIVEKKNMLYQNFLPSDIDMNKVEALSLRFFNIKFINKRVDISTLSKYDLVILCADNNKIRKDTWLNWTTNKINFIDSRANGRAIGLYSNNTDNYVKTLSDDDSPTSCQNPFQISNKEIEFGNVCVASILTQSILNYSRKHTLPNDLVLHL